MQKYLTTIILVAVLSGCSFCSHDESHYYEMATALTKLSAAIESTVRYKNPPAGLSDQELIDLSVQHDPSLAKPFADYTVKVLAQDRHAILLVCSDASSSILEDLGCTKELDQHRWQNGGSCQFTLTTDQCP